MFHCITLCLHYRATFKKWKDTVDPANGSLYKPVLPKKALDLATTWRFMASYWWGYE